MDILVGICASGAELLSDLSSGAHGVSVAAVFVTTMIMNLYLAVSMAEKMITGTIHSSRSSRSSIAKSLHHPHHQSGLHSHIKQRHR
ncbi:hypothetical protein P389DRAFT_7889 [Cystobasidium minutum MCA 4210]|uniref:uncharacterized protein n=1 Tax=Cystobasidium minutum MCA 4210 TaxID=1397322 RepID=UPI0034CFCDAC|eukprot:jgi/Rhomi1/7889/CE7888_2017